MKDIHVWRVLTFLSLGLPAVMSFGQDVQMQVRTSRGPHFIGTPVTVQIAIEGLEETPQPESTILTMSDGLKANLAGINPRVSRMVQIFGNRRVERKTVTHEINYLVVAEEPGEYSLGPFVVSQNGMETTSEAISLSFNDVEIDPHMRIKLILPEKPFYPGQRAKVGIEWSYLEAELKAVSSLRIQSPLFDQFSFIDKKPQRDDQILPLQTAAGEVQLVGTVRKENIDGKQFLVIAGERTLIVDKSGEYQLSPITAAINKVTRWKRDSFGFGGFDDFFPSQERPAEAAPTRALGIARTLLVKPLPLDGRPDSFAGAIGLGFTLDVTANRTVVRVGDPIKLTVSIGGAGNLENASLPSLAADGGMNADYFRLPEGDLSGTLEGDSKRFEVSVRVLDESVTEIPALAYSWFDPETANYHTTHSKPIALNVQSANIVSANDVVSNVLSPETGSDSSTTEGDRQVDVAASTGPTFTLSGANIAIEDQAGTLLRDTNAGFGGFATQMLIYGCGLLLVAIAFFDRRRQDVDPALRMRRRNLLEQKKRITKVSSQSSKSAAEETAAALRSLLAEMPSAGRDEAETIIAACEAVVYSPHSGAHDRLDDELIQRATKFADRCIKEAE